MLTLAFRGREGTRVAQAGPHETGFISTPAARLRAAKGFNVTIGRMFVALLSLGLGLAARANPPQKAGTPGTPPATSPASSEPKAYVTVDGAPIAVPLFSEQAESVAAARVGDEVISVAQLSRALATIHEAQRGDGARATASNDFRPVLERLVNARLLLEEAREMGIADLPEVTEMVREFERVTAREMLQAHATKDVKPDAAEVERQYREMVREFKVRSILFPRESDAKALHAAAAKAGGDFAALAKKAIADKKAKGNEEARFVRVDKLLPNVATALVKLKPGQVTQPIKVKEGFTIARLEEIRYGDDPAARAEAEKASIVRQKKLVLKTFYDGIVKRYATVDRELLKRLDLEAKKPGIKALEQDKRIVARIQGAEPITVSELTKKVLEQFYHGVDRATAAKRVNRQIAPTFDAILSDRIVPLEARRLGISDTAEYKRRVADQLDGATFTLFVQRAVVPQVKVTDQDVRAYYDGHKAEFAYPIFFKLDGIGYANVKEAQAALEKLRAGTDLKWLKANTSGQLDQHTALYQFGGMPIAATAMPKELRKQLSAAKVGDIRLFTDAGQSYVVRVADVTPESQKPFEEVKAEIREKLFLEKLNAAISDWAGKLRKARPVQVFITKIG